MSPRLTPRQRFELEVHRRAGVRRWSPPHAAAAPAHAAPPASARASGVEVRPKPAASTTAAASIKTAESSVAVDRLALAPERDDRKAILSTIEVEISTCRRCKLCDYRTKTVAGEGALDPPILFVGEGPGADEDASGRPFVGRAGQLLDKMIAAIKFRRDEVFIANIIKCRPPDNRTPEPDEVAACFPYLERQIELLRPRLICTLGLPATRALLPETRAISAVRGREQEWRGLPVIPTFHPAYLLRSPEAKHAAWADLKLIARRLGRPVDGAA